MLQVNNLHTYYGNIKALRGVSFHIEQGEIVALIGANGAGKSTLLSTIAGVLTPKQGDIIFNDKSIVKTNAKQRVEMGIIL